MGETRQGRRLEEILLPLIDNLYIHFPFCRTKCSYCNLYSRVCPPPKNYLEQIILSLNQSVNRSIGQSLYFGGGSPALCDLKPLLSALQLPPSTSTSPEFTVELHPLDVTPSLLSTLKQGGVNRISMGVQSLDDATLRSMGRAYTAKEAHAAFNLVKTFFDNAGIDLIVGYPGDDDFVENLERLELDRWGLKHCSVYSLQNERGLKNVPGDDTLLDRLSAVAAYLDSFGLKRYEISNYALPGYECRHNLAVWRGEDYLGLGDGACGRIGLKRTRGVWRGEKLEYEEETVTPEFDRKERNLFRLRTREGIDAALFPELIPSLNRFVAQGLLHPPSIGQSYTLTSRGMEVCDAILVELV